MLQNIFRAGLIGALGLGVLAFGIFTAIEAADGARFHAPPAWMIGGIYGLASAALGFVLGALGGALYTVFRHRPWAGR